MFIRDLQPGQLFSMPDVSTIYRAERVTVGSPGQGTMVIYSIPGAPRVGECQMVGPSLTTVVPREIKVY